MEQIEIGKKHRIARERVDYINEKRKEEAKKKGERNPVLLDAKPYIDKKAARAMRENLPIYTSSMQKRSKGK